jgi:hypothetical protein
MMKMLGRFLIQKNLAGVGLSARLRMFKVKRIGLKQLPARTGSIPVAAFHLFLLAHFEL